MSIKVRGTGRAISNFALPHYVAAKTFVQQANAIEVANVGRPFGPFYDGLRTFVSAAVLSSTAAMEAFINESFVAHGGALRTKLKDFDAEFWGDASAGAGVLTRFLSQLLGRRRRRRGIEMFSILDKYNKALKLLGKPKIAKGDPIYVHAELLIGMRNYLIHFKPLWDAPRDREQELINGLTGKFTLSPYVDPTSDFVTMRCMTASCGDWAVRTTKDLIHEYGRRTGADPTKVAAFT